MSIISDFIKRRSWLSLTIDAIILILVILLIIPATRKNTIAFMLKPTIFLHQPKVLGQKPLVTNTDYEWKLKDLSGTEWQLSDFKDKVLFINLWATWCPPCIAEMPDLEKLYQQYGHNVEFLFISNEPVELLKKFTQKKGIKVPVYHPLTPYPEVFSTQTLPTTYIVDTKGQVVVYKQGLAQWNSNRVHNIINTLLNN
jgi:thiol-disulfide isomerase/thioredoxin